MGPPESGRLKKALHRSYYEKQGGLLRFLRGPSAWPRCRWMAWLRGARADPASHARRRGASASRCHAQGRLRQNTTHVTASAKQHSTRP